MFDILDPIVNSSLELVKPPTDTSVELKYTPTKAQFEYYLFELLENGRGKCTFSDVRGFSMLYIQTSWFIFLFFFLSFFFFWICRCSPLSETSAQPVLESRRLLFHFWANLIFSEITVKSSASSAAHLKLLVF